MFITATTVAFAALAIYLGDCVLLVERGQGIFELSGKGVQFGTRYYLLAGRPIIVLNPLTPWRLGVKSRSIFGGEQESQVRAREIASLRPLAFLGATQALLVLVLCPLLLHFMSRWLLVAALVVAYLVSLAIGIALWPERLKLGLSTYGYFNMVLSALVCLPLSINMVRKAALVQSSRFGALAIIRHLPVDVQSQAKKALIGQLEEASLEAADGSMRANEIHTLLRTLQSGRTHVRP